MEIWNLVYRLFVRSSNRFHVEFWAVFHVFRGGTHWNGLLCTQCCFICVLISFAHIFSFCWKVLRIVMTLLNPNIVAYKSFNLNSVMIWHIIWLVNILLSFHWFDYCLSYIIYFIYLQTWLPKFIKKRKSVQST